MTGVRLDDPGLILQGAVPASLLALAVQGVFELLERRVVPRGLAACAGRVKATRPTVSVSNQVRSHTVKERTGHAIKTSALGTPTGWQTHRPGPFLLHRDGTRESPLAFALSVAAGLDDQPRWLDSRYLYDAAGSALFERITRQPEYYQTRTEERLLAQHAQEIRARVGDVALVELGSGSSSKTRRLLDAWVAAGKSRYFPIDVSEAALEQACASLMTRYPCLGIEAVAASLRTRAAGAGRRVADDAGLPGLQPGQSGQTPAGPVPRSGLAAIWPPAITFWSGSIW